MEDFVKYQSLKRLGTTEVEGINDGPCLIFPKLDGTNGSVWLGADGTIKAGSRTRELSLGKDNDNAGFYGEVLQDERYIKFFNKYPNVRLYGEWLVPHSIRTYLENSWRKFYVFDVVEVKSNDDVTYYPYSEYKCMLEEFNIEYIPAIFSANSVSVDRLIALSQQNDYLIKENQGSGEGIVIKNYGYKNRYGRTVWAKVVTSEFKSIHRKAFDPTEIQESDILEAKIANKYVTLALCEKTKAKIELEMDGWDSKAIPRLLHTVFYDLVREDAWNFIKENKNPKIDFKALQQLTNRRIKELLPEVF